MSIVDFFRRLFSHAPSYAGYLELGYKARTYNSDFIFSRRYEICTENVHQGIEPHNKILGAWIDFEVEDACIVITLHEGQVFVRSDVDRIRDLFDFVYERGPHLFCMNRHMDFNDPKVEETVRVLNEIFS